LKTKQISVLVARSLSIYNSISTDGVKFSHLSDPWKGLVGHEKSGNCAVTRAELKEALNYLSDEGLVELSPLKRGDFLISRKDRGVQDVD
jgi:hypothetical protein